MPEKNISGFLKGYADQTRWMQLFPFLLIYFILNIISWQFPFFWDNILNSRSAQFYLENNWSSIIVPIEIDAGHPPLFNLYLSFVWAITGASLWSAHLAMLPILFGIVIQFHRLATKYLPGPAILPAMILLLLEPTFLSISTQVSPDLAIVFFLLLTINSLDSDQPLFVILGSIGLSMVSFRGILILPALYLIGIILKDHKKNISFLLRYSLQWVPVGATVLAWFALHYSQAGWVISPPPETYGTHRVWVGFADILKNAAITGWRFLDEGRVFLWLFAIAFLAFGPKIKSGEFKKIKILFWIPAIAWGLLFIPFSNPIGHRYFIVCYLIFGLGFAWIWSVQSSSLIKSLSAGIVIIGLISGHFWIYPDGVAKGWDSTLTHTGWFKVQDEMDLYIEANAIDRAEICSAFPDLVPRKYSHPGKWQANISQSYLDYSDDSLKGSCKYVLQSNIMNGFETENIQELMRDWILKVQFNSGMVYLRLFERTHD